jgi:hypothetical protein
VTRPSFTATKRTKGVVANVVTAATPPTIAYADPSGTASELAFEVSQLRNTTGMPSTFETGAQKRRHNLLGQANANNATTNGKNVGIVMLTGHASGVKIVAESGANPAHLVRCKLFALAAATNHDAEICQAIANRATNPRTDRRVVDRLGGVRTLVVDIVAEGGKEAQKMLFEVETSVVGADGDAHAMSVRRPPPRTQAAPAATHGAGFPSSYQERF